MSPLARSLLALATLLTATDAKVGNQPTDARCAGIKIDIMSKQFGDYMRTLEFEFHVDGAKQLHTIIDRCAEIGGVISSQEVSVCNEFSPKLPGWYPPRVSALGDEQLSPVFAACDPEAQASHKCGQLTIHVTQACCHPRHY